MKKAILKLLLRMGYVVIKLEEWQKIQTDRIAFAETSRESSRELGTAVARAAALDDQLAESRGQLAACLTDRHSLNLRLARSQAHVQALMRRKHRLQAELRVSRDQLSTGDSSGRIRMLEEENRALWQRLIDLEAYLKETRGTTRPYYL
jgi:chromosome segregation ATPase